MTETPDQHDEDDAMTDAELRVVRERLGLTGDALAELLGVQSRSVRRWESGERVVPDAVRERIEEMERIAAAAVGRAIDALNDAVDPVLVTYRADEDLWAAHPGDRPMPASWHRAIVGRAIEEVPGVRVQYAVPAAGSPGVPMPSGLVELPEAAEILGMDVGEAALRMRAAGAFEFRAGKRWGYARADVEAARDQPA